MRSLVIRTVALVAAFVAGAAIGAIADSIVARYDGRPSLAPAHRRALDDDECTG